MAHKSGKKQKVTLYNVFILMFIGLGSMTYGYTASIIATTLGKPTCAIIRSPGSHLTRIGQPTFIEYFGLATVSNGTDLISTMNGLFQTGGVIGTLLLPTVADKWGRKWALAVVRRSFPVSLNHEKLMNSQAALLNLVSGAGLASSTHIAQFIVFRFIAGAGAFSILAAVPVSHSSQRYEKQC